MRNLPLFIAAALLLAAAGPSWARQPDPPTVLRGRVFDTAGAPLANARVRVLDPAIETFTDFQGSFLLAVPAPPSAPCVVEASRADYRASRQAVARLDAGEALEFRLERRPIPVPQVEVTTTRAVERKSAVGFTELDRAGVSEKYWAQDVPMLLAGTPSVFAYSDAGNGVGYSYVRVRGFSQRRVAVSINGVPENDPESHEVYWVDHPDLLASTSLLQVQRGAGTVLSGASAVGGSINLETPLVTPERAFRLSAGYGSFNTRRYAAEYESGLFEDRYAVSARYSRILSDGYRDQSWSSLWSYFLSAVRLDKGLTSRLNIYGGPEQLHLAYYGVDRPYLDGAVSGDRDRDRRYNPLEWKGETDNFFEPHYELIQSARLSDAATLTSTLFLYTGEGYYDDMPWGPQDLASRHLPTFEVADSALFPSGYYEADTAGNPVRLPDGKFRVTASELTQRLWVQNQHYGWVPRVRLAHAGGRGELTVGGEARGHSGRHFGELTWARALAPGVEPNQRMYDYTGHVRVLSAFAQETYLARPDLRVTASLQLRSTRYAVDQDRFNGYDFALDYTFLNPRVAANWNLDPRWHAFASFARVAAEPILGEIYRADDPSSKPLFGELDPARGIYNDPLIHPERMNDFEAGGGYRSGAAYARLTAFWMDFRDEIVPNGQVDRYGVPITGNAARSSHRGIELEGSWRASFGLSIEGNLTVSRNRFGAYLEHVDSATTNDYSGNVIAGFPGRMANLTLAWRRGGSRVGLTLAGVGTQYLDNTEDNRRTPELRAVPGYAARIVPGYALLNASATLDLGALAGARGLLLDLRANNLLDRRHETSGYVYGDVPYFYPAATRNVYAAVKAEF
ncbi:MAG: TonB-dependent receptor [Candidatus Eisenbacteria bacterium]|nr:TonB-dependent receptor [Candidatus Eisenbacteria bacterium]